MGLPSGVPIHSASPAWIWIIVAAAIGSLPMGWILAWSEGKSGRLTDLGAMGVARALGPKLWVPCFAAEQLKGMLAAMVAGYGLGHLGAIEGPAGSGWMWTTAGAAAMVLHRWSPLTGFRVARGSGAVLGVMLGIWPVMTPAVLGALVVFLAAMAMGLGRWSRVVAAVAIPVLTLAWTTLSARVGLYPRPVQAGDGPWPFVVLGLVVAVPGISGVMGTGKRGAAGRG